MVIGTGSEENVGVAVNDRSACAWGLAAHRTHCPPVGSAGLFVRARPRARSQAGAWPASRRFMLALAGKGALACLAAAAVRLIGVAEHNTLAAAAGVGVSSPRRLALAPRGGGPRRPRPGAGMLPVALL